MRYFKSIDILCEPVSMWIAGHPILVSGSANARQ